MHPNRYGKYQGQQTQFTGQNVPNFQPGFQLNQYGNYQGQQGQFTGQNFPNFQPGFQPNQYGNYQGQQGQFTGQNFPNFQPGFQPNQYGNYQGQQGQFMDPASSMLAVIIKGTLSCLSIAQSLLMHRCTVLNASQAASVV